MLSHVIQAFLKEKIEKNSLSRKDLARFTYLSYSTISGLINASKPSPNLSSLIKLSIFFKCSIDSILGRAEFDKDDRSINLDLSLNKTHVHLKRFIKKQLIDKNLRISSLCQNIGCSAESLTNFIKDDHSQQTIGSAIIVAIAEYFKVSIDEMLERVEVFKKESASEQTATPLHKEPA